MLLTLFTWLKLQKSGTYTLLQEPHNTEPQWGLSPPPCWQMVAVWTNQKLVWTVLGQFYSLCVTGPGPIRCQNNWLKREIRFILGAGGDIFPTGNCIQNHVLTPLTRWLAGFSSHLVFFLEHQHRQYTVVLGRIRGSPPVMLLKACSVLASSDVAFAPYLLMLNFAKSGC